MAGFHANGADMRYGHEPELALRLDALARFLGSDLFAVGSRSGHRTPSQSIAVGGTANDPHTQGLAVDVNDTIKRVPEKVLNRFGLTRPMTTWVSPTDGTVHDERNHIQLKPGRRPPVTDFGSAGKGDWVAPATPAVIRGASRVGGPLARDAATDALGAGVAAALVDNLWGSIEPRAAYAGLFVLLIGAGAWLAVTGFSRSSGLRREPA